MSTSFHGKGTARTPKTISLRKTLDEAVFVGAEDIEVRRCVNRAEQCCPGDVFIPLHNGSRDEHDQVDEALRRGAVAVVAERLLPVSAPQCLVENTNEAYGIVCQALAGQPAQRMLTIGIVGTHGKTTTSLFVSAMLKRLGGQVAYYTSLGASNSIECDRSATKPPAAKRLSNWMREADAAGAPAAVLEITPAMLQNRATAGVEFDLLIVTGLRPGQHAGAVSGRQMRRLLSQLGGQLKSHGMLLYNADDALAAKWAEQSQLTAVNYGLDAAEHVRGKRLYRSGGEQQVLAIAGNMIMPMTLKIPGDHVARAAMAAVATSWMFDLSIPEAVAGIEALESIPGRMQRIGQSVDTPIFIDAGFTPDRLAVGIHALRSHNMGPATVVVDLDCRLTGEAKQRLGELLEKQAEKVVLTSASLSTEAARAAAMDVLGGCRSPGRVQVIPDRREAIAWAVNNTDQGCVLLSGCGVANWVRRDGANTNDESEALEAIQRKQVAKPIPALGIFPPSEPTSFFSH